MPSRNIRKQYVADSFYHVYGRGVSKSEIFLDDQDYSVFLNLFKRYLSPLPAKDNYGRDYPSLRGQIELVAYCLMPNHFHMMVYQHDEAALKKLMQGILTSYATYFNRKYKRSGPVLESRYKASRITDDVYLMHISRYIHMNHRSWKTWEWSSLHDYLGHKNSKWLQEQRALELFETREDYSNFLDDYAERKDQLKFIASELANEDDD